MEGLAALNAYGSGEGQNTQHYYAGTIDTPKKKKKKKNKSNKRKKVCKKD